MRVKISIFSSAPCTSRPLALFLTCRLGCVAAFAAQPEPAKGDWQPGDWDFELPDFTPSGDPPSFTIIDQSDVPGWQTTRRWSN